MFGYTVLNDLPLNLRPARVGIRHAAQLHVRALPSNVISVSGIIIDSITNNNLIDITSLLLTRREVYR